MNLMAADQVTRGKRLKRFERMVRAYRVRPENGQWIVKKLGGKSRIFSAKLSPNLVPLWLSERKNFEAVQLS